jgi:hypothetical protein
MGHGALGRLASFTRIRDFVEDIRGLSTASLSIIKLFVGALVVVNLLAGAWCVLVVPS